MQRVAVFKASQANGVFLWLGDGESKEFDQRVALNTELGQIADAQRMLVTYRGVEGDSQKALLMLPVGYKPGVQYPLITYVYASWIVSDTNMGPRFEKSFVSSLNLHLIPAYGYALLIPSMPLGPQGVAGDPYLDLPKGVMAAVDKVIDLGIADPQRLGVMGHSYGGYSTYTLVTYTQRFKAAIALAGPSDLVSLYGTFSPLRYDGYAHESLLFAGMAESGQIRMGNPPWVDLWRYLRNSPLNYVDRVETPLMIVHGDMDYVPIQQGEEFFTALYRLGKPAEFVRYWGEGHIISSPANTRDLWRRTFTWFDRYLQAPASAPTERRISLPAPRSSWGGSQPHDRN
jgi:dipeptidyl aminopeptidase/acylaminoacyl peptidase